MKKNLLVIFIAFLILTIQQASSQINDAAPQVSIPPAPEAASLGKYIDVPVDYYNGLAQVSVPLYTLKERDIELPISISYYARGHKVEDIASWVGLGWSLNASGVVTREVRNIPDDYSGNAAQSYFESSEFTVDSINRIVNLLESYGSGGLNYNEEVGNALTIGNLLTDGCIDLEPDVFYVHLDGLKIKFSFDIEGEIITDTDQNILIDFTKDANGEISSWTITNNNGLRYSFEARENTTSSRLGRNMNQLSCSSLWKDLSYTSSWYLTRISSAATGDFISFEYEDYSIDHGFTESESMSHVLPVGQCSSLGDFSPPLTRIQNQLTTTGKRLSRILSKTGHTVDFVANGENRQDVEGNNAFSLDSIKVTNLNGKQVKTYQFAYDYSIGAANDRLTLKKIWEVGADGAKLPPFIFKYNATKLPSRDSKAVDHWGYFNGKNNSQLLPPLFIRTNANSEFTYQEGADRYPSEAHTKAGILERIEYPTGGFRSFTYELNDFSYISNDPLSALQYFECDPLTLNVTAVGQNNNHVERDTISFNKSTFVSVSVQFSPTQLGDLAPIIPYVKITKLVDQDTNQLIYHQKWSEEEVINTFLSLEEGVYMIESFAYVNTGNEADFADIYLDWKNCDENSEPVNTMKCGGLRIKEVITNDGISNQQLTTSFTYRDENNLSTGVFIGDKNLPESSLYKRVGFPYYPYEKVNTIAYDVTPGLTPTYTSCLSINRSASPVYLLGSGSHIEYAQVNVTTGADSGSKSYYFTSSRDRNFNDEISFESPVLPPISNAHKRGHIKLNNTIDSQSLMKQSDSTQYEFKSDALNSFKLDMNCACPTPFPLNLRYNFKSVRLGLGRPLKIEKTRFTDDNGTKRSFQTTELFQYNNEGLLKSKTVEEGSGITIHTRYKYPTDYVSSLDAGIDSLVKKNRTANSIEVTTWRKDSLVASEIKKHGIVNGSALFETSLSLYKKRNEYSQPVNVDGKYTSLMFDESAYKTEMTVLSYNANRQITEFQQSDGIVNAILWGYNQSLPICQVFNANVNQIYYNSFEEDENIQEISSAKSGAKAKLLSGNYSISPTQLVNGTYSLSYWVKRPDADLWEKRSSTINYSGQPVAIPNPYSAGSNYYLDEIRIHPQEARMNSYSYEPLLGRTSELNENGIATYYSYDAFGRLEFIRDNERSIIKKISYYYSIAD